MSLADKFIGSRGDKQAAAEQKRKDALSQLISSLSTRQTAQAPQQQRQQASPLQTILRDPTVRQLLAQKLGGLTGP
jgi:hypothetical protein